MNKLTTIISIILLSTTSLFADKALTGMQIIENVYNRASPKAQEAVLKMSLVNKQGKERIRNIKQVSKKFSDVEKSIMFFLSPADVRNTSFMNWSYTSNKDDDQWIYLPVVKKVKRISSDSKSDYFMGSDFTYDDLGDRHPSADTHKILKEEKFNGEDCYVIESKPKNPDYMYSKTVTWVIKGKNIGLKKEFYDEDGKHLKTLLVEKYEKIDNYLIITKSVMKNIQKKQKTVMSLSEIKVDKDISSNKFTERMMKRGIK
jgi:hypothetical protein